MSEIVNPLKWWYAEHDTTLSGHQIIAREDEAPYAYTCAGNAQEICDAGNALAELTKAQIGDAENWLSLPEPSFETIGERVKLLYDQLNYSKETIKFQSERIRELQRSNQALESALHSKEEHAAWRRYFMAACEIYADERARRAALARSQAECAEALRIINARIQSAIEAECDRCKKKHQLFVEPSTGFYTHTLGGNYCNAHHLHNLLNTEAAQKARAAALDKKE